MSRPKHPGVPLPASCIRDLRQRQAYYDEDPERYEREEREQEEARQEAERRQEEEYRRWEQEQD